MSEVSILPQGSTVQSDVEYVEVTQPPKTYKIDFDKGRIVGFCDEVEALKQTIDLILETERFQYLIYSWDYGSELDALVGMDKSIIESEAKRRIQEALTQDDRISSVDDFIFTYDNDSVLIQFTVYSIYGEIEVERSINNV